MATSSKKWWRAGHEVGVGEVMLCICTSKKLSLISLSYYLLYNSRVLCCVVLCYVMLYNWINSIERRILNCHRSIPVLPKV